MQSSFNGHDQVGYMRGQRTVEQVLDQNGNIFDIDGRGVNMVRIGLSTSVNFTRKVISMKGSLGRIRIMATTGRSSVALY